MAEYLQQTGTGIVWLSAAFDAAKMIFASEKFLTVNVLEKFMTTLCKHHYALCLMALLAVSATAVSADYWLSASDASVVTNNDCGAVSAVHGEPTIRRSFQTGDDLGAPASVADRINSGDEVIVPFGARLEMTSGANVVAVIGAGSRVRLGGLRGFADSDDREATRLDLEVLEGEMRVQVRLNEEKPMAALVQLNGAEVLVTRGDVEVAIQGGWRTAVLSGAASARLKRSGVAGAPFPIAANRLVGSMGDEPLAAAEADAIRVRIPFSFETRSAALPPLPHANTVLEAP